MSVGYQFLDVRRDGPVEHLMLNRPEVRNAFNDALVEELRSWTQAVAIDPAVRVIVLGGRGPAFCAGADVDWMARTALQTREENLRDATAAAGLFASLNAMPKLVVGRVQGAALGGGAGLVAVCDVVVAGKSATFGFPEVRLGILPAVVSPFVLRAIGPRAARDLFLTGDRFDAREALRVGLVHQVVAAEELAAAGDRKIASLLASGPEAVRVAKVLIAEVAWKSPEEVATKTVQTIAERRASAEAKEGLTAFLEKRKPAWVRVRGDKE